MSKKSKQRKSFKSELAEALVIITMAFVIGIINYLTEKTK